MIKSLVRGVILPEIIWAKILRGKVKKSQFFLGILILNLANSFDNKKESKYIPKKAAKKSKIAYPPKRNCLKNSIGIIFLFLNIIIV